MAGLTVGNPVSLVIALASGNVIPGDTLQLRGGTYTLADMEINYHGTAEAPITITNYPGETVTFRPASGYRIMLITGDYITITGDIVFDGINVASECIKITNAGDEIPIGVVLSGLECKNAPLNGVMISGTGVSATLTNLEIHDIGTNGQHHGIYVQEGTIGINGCEIYNVSGHGIHPYGGTSTIEVYGNYIHDCTVAGIGAYSPGGAKIYSNVLRRNGVNLRCRYSVNNLEIYYNTSVEAVNHGMECRAISLDAFNAKIYNNIFYGNGAIGAYFQTHDGGVLADDCIDFYNNLITGNVTSDLTLGEAADVAAVDLANNLIGGGFDPITDDAGAGYKPGVGNAAKGAGVAVVGITTDYGGNARANPPTIGAWE